MDHISNQPKTVAQAKQALLVSASRIDYLEPVKQYPLRSLMIAFSVGVIASTKQQSKPLLSPSLLTLLMSTFRHIASPTMPK